jgi:uncharacterized protein
MKLRFRWDERKADLNLLKHGISFYEATFVWSDRFGIELFDSIYPAGELRYIRIGRNSKKGLVAVVFCEPEDNVVRIISARYATLKERRAYEERI